MAEVTNKAAIARKLGISRQSLYYRPKKPKEDEDIKQKILAAREEHPAYGHRRMATHLGFNKKRINRIMKLFHIRPKLMRGRPNKSGDNGRTPTNIPNLAKGICPIKAGALWAGDFTYIPWKDDFIYLATVLDVYTREIVGWHIGMRHTTDLVIKAFIDAVERTKKTPQIFHSDQGSEYVSGEYDMLLQNIFNDLGLLIAAIHSQVRYYNERQIHSALKIPPAIFRRQCECKNTAVTAA